MNKRVLSLLVENTTGVLSRVAGLFTRRGYNIDSITAGVTADPRFTRITVVVRGDENILDQIEKQLGKLEDVIAIKELKDDASVCRELAMIKVEVSEENRQGVIAIANIYRAKIVDVDKDSMIIELLGSTNKIDAFISLLNGYKILELARTGITGLSRGTKDVTWID